ncbi:hypothetical protein BDA96_10G190700 [Sorghum bicolor]|uniref:Uncharacterized protein n=1 Tax=Sorghum bicolor TaxID=4558 RepID=A0A921Q2Q9_SORBI|nr:hypothetical protein BDA96_10G190700 [Sorghum bicolor]
MQRSSTLIFLVDPDQMIYDLILFIHQERIGTQERNAILFAFSHSYG